MTKTVFSESITIEDLEEDPYAIYQRLRAESPVVDVPCTNIWFATTWDTVESVATNAKDFVAAFPGSPLERSFGSPFILTADGDVHKELRGMIDPFYRAKQVNVFFDPLCRPIVQYFLDALPEGEPVDIMAEYFENISAVCVARTLGFKDVDAAKLRNWFHGLAQGGINYEGDPVRQAICDETTAEIDAVMIPLLEKLALDRDESVLSNMLFGGMPEGQTRPIERILPTIKVTLLGGMQEPGHGAGNALVGLLQNPDQLAALRANRTALVRAAVTEGLRWVSPIGSQVRTAVRDIEVAGTLIPAGTSVGTILPSANRDETRFVNPDQFNIFRSEKFNAAFGFGTHICAGRTFAPQLMALMLELLFERFGQIEFTPGFVPSFRGWEFRTAPEISVILRR